MNALNRFTSTIRHQAGVARGAIARRPRRFATVGLLTIIVAVLAIGELALLGTPAPSTASPAPSFTVRSGWTLAELQRRIEAGEIDAITAAPATGAEPAGQLLARTKAGQVVAIHLSVSATEAVTALTSLGYGSLLTTEAIGVAATPSGAAATGDALAYLIPFAALAVMVLVVVRMSRRTPAAGRDGAAKFMTIMPPDPDAPSPDPAAAGDGSLQPVVRIALDDVAGCDEAKLELTEAIEFLRTPDRFRRLGARIPRGIMLYGPPGTGKTMLARAVAAEAGVPFHYASGSEFVEKYVGVGAKRVRDLFAQARKLDRGVIFFDEFDAIGKARGGPNSHEEREQTLNQLLVELDGFGSTDDVIVIAATNRLDTLDSAVLRPGRFTRKIHVGMPDVKGRQAILEVHARNKPLSPATDLEETARKTYGFSGAMLADLLNEAAIMAARRGGDAIEPQDLHAGWLKVAVGTSRRRSMDERERSIIAAHEVGHAICGRVHGDKRRVEEISLFAHGEALGVTVSSQEDNDLPSETDLRARLIALMGGRAAEEILFHEVTGGASNDFEAANAIATSMVTRWGMGRDPEASDGGISGRGILSFFVPTGSDSLPSEIQPAATRAIRSILDEAYAQASETLIAHLETLRRLAAYLVEQERVDGATFDELFDGRIEVPGAGDEWRAATSRPRAWADVVDLAGRRVRPPAEAAAVAATSPGDTHPPSTSAAAPAGGAVLTAEPAAIAVATSGAPAIPAGPAIPAAAGPAVAATLAAVTPSPAPATIGAASPSAEGERHEERERHVLLVPSLPTGRLRLRGRRSTTRRVRSIAAGWLARAERWVRSSEPGADGL